MLLMICHYFEIDYYASDAFLSLFYDAIDIRHAFAMMITPSPLFRFFRRCFSIIDMLPSSPCFSPALRFSLRFLCFRFRTLSLI